MKPLDELDLDTADVERIDEIIALRTGQSLLSETMRWRRRRNGAWLTIALSLLLAGGAGFVLYQYWA